MRGAEQRLNHHNLQGKILPILANGDTVHVTDTVQGDLGEFTDGQSKNYSRTFSCDADEGENVCSPRQLPELSWLGDLLGETRDADVIIMLRLQNERMSGAMLPSAAEFAKTFGLTTDKLALARPDAIVMHPGPINRGVEIDSSVADGQASVILPQVTFGIAVRMAVMSTLAGGKQ